MIRAILFIACLIMLFKAPAFALALLLVWMFFEGIIGIITYIVGDSFKKMHEEKDDWYD